MIDRRKAELAACGAAAFLVVLLALRFLHHDSAAAPVALDSAPQREDARRSTTAAHASTLVIDVAGEVRRPGVYRVPEGSRADAAVALAGGVTSRAERAAVNLAQPLRDGQQVIVPRRGAAASARSASSPAGTAAAPGSAAQPLSLSTATPEQLDTLAGIGPTLAARIVQYRDSHGGFRSVEELRQVSGIGAKRFGALRKAVQP